jgi:hypothetical protein
MKQQDIVAMEKQVINPVKIPICVALSMDIVIRRLTIVEKVAWADRVQHDCK